MNKEKLHIFYDVNVGEIRATIVDNKGTYVSTSAWQDILKSLNLNRTFKRTCSHDGLIVEYSDIIVQIDNWKICAKNPTVSEYLRKNIAIQQNNRLEKVRDYNAIIAGKNSNHNEDVVPPFLQKALKERHEQALNSTTQENTSVTPTVQQNTLKVKRKNKYTGAVLSIVTGTLVLSMLSTPPMSLQKGTKDETLSQTTISNIPTVEYQSFTQQISNEDDFKINLSIDDLFNSNDNSINYNCSISFKYDDRSQTDKAIETRIKYGDLIEKYAKKCGIDPKIVLGIATQESGNHELGLRAGSKGGLMQIEISYWNGKEITYYDFDDKESYIIKIDDNVNDVENNILIGCAILQNELKIFNYNIPLAIQSYNEGYSNMSKILDETSAKTGLTKTSIINNDNCLEWLNYTHVVNGGDPNYINNVLSWTGYGYSFYEFVCQKENGDLKVCTTIPITNDTVKAI